MTAPTQQEQPVALWAGVLSYLVPGLGQICQGRIGKGLLFMVALLGLFHAGQAMGAWKNVYIPVEEDWNDRFAADGKISRGRRLQQLPHNLYQRWHYLGQFWIGVAAWPALWQYFDMPVPAKETNPFVHDFQAYRAGETEREINDFWVNSDKTPDLGWIYTVIAGVLNLLVIYDAYAGPAFHSDPHEAKKEPKPAEAPA